MKIKPVIKYHKGWYGERYWFCEIFISGHFIIGFGNTPSEAYKDWLIEFTKCKDKE